MECVHQLMSKQEYNKKICGFRTNYDLFFSLMNTLLQVKFNSYSYCFCDWINQEKCLICEIITDFNGFEEELTKNMKKIFWINTSRNFIRIYLNCFNSIRPLFVASWTANTSILSENDPEETVNFSFLIWLNELKMLT